MRNNKVYRFFFLTLFVVLIKHHYVNGQTELCDYEPNRQCFDPTCGVVVQAFDGTPPCECRDSDIGETFSSCIGGTRTVMSFWKPPAVCRGGVSLPPPTQGIPCDVACAEGTFLNTTTKACQPCADGSVSMGGSQIYTDWHSWPAQFTTSCTGGSSNIPCQPWQWDVDSVYSGDNHLLNSITSTLELRFYLVRPGSISYRYRISTEQGFDGMKFLINGTLIFSTSNTGWTTYTRSLAAGHHTVQWVYFKDYSITRGEDRGIISSITLLGTSYGVTQCRQCPPGTYSNETVPVECQPCPANTHQDQFGQSSCLPCPAGTYSLEGATTCTSQINCSLTSGDDLTSSTTPCVNGQRTRFYAWITPRACDNPPPLPANTTESCQPVECGLGRVLNQTSGLCDYCEPGTYNNGTDTCQECPVGTQTSPRTVIWDSFASLQPPFTSACNGANCWITTWRQGYNFTDSGLGHGTGAQSWLKLTANVTSDTSLEFTYAAPCQGSATLTLSVDDTTLAVLTCDDTCEISMKTYGVSFGNIYNDSNIHLAQIQWTWDQRSAVPTVGSTLPCDRAIITSIMLVGAVSLGGSETCQNCAGGYIAPNSKTDTCQPCPIGHTSIQVSNETVEAGTVCTLCDGNSFTDVEGSHACFQCGTNTVANDDHTACEFACSNVTIGGDSYDLSILNTFQLNRTNQNGNESSLAYSLTGSLCSNDARCLAQGLQSHICLSTNSNDTVLDIGKIVSMTPVNGSKGIFFEFSGPHSRCSTTLSLRCNTAVNVGRPYISTTFDLDATPCQIDIEWNSRFGCPLCTSLDYNYTDSECQNGVVSRRYYQVNPNCYGGQLLPPTQTQNCLCLVNNGGCDPLAKCTDRFGSRVCGECPAGYSGTGETRCKAVCDPPCQNGGTCPFPNTCDCSTAPGYTGKVCTQPVCEPVCQNGGECVAPNTCDCSKTRHNGTLCENPICDPPCLNNGTCSAPDLCVCGDNGFLGPQCDIALADVAPVEVVGISKGTVAGIVIIGCLIILAAVGGAIFFYLKHRRLYAEYNRLSTSHVPMDEEISGPGRIGLEE
eukprot:TRINITY_DN606_c0_g1_i1.p1 TRINITY_DN606_c0_g1~~TRINITY_DN606_c0_g1_i1.p1  ORF type:complete len:1056 (+),score=151.68 TRINITY_DN606_c0_g1_i1:23-3190(+)